MPRESKAAAGGVSTERDQAWLTKPFTSVSVLCLAFVLAVSGGKWLSIADSVVPLPCGFYSEYTVEGAAAQEKACWRIQVGQKGSAGKGKSHALPVLLWWRTSLAWASLSALSISAWGALWCRADPKVTVSLSTPCLLLFVFILKFAPLFCNNPQGAGCCASCASMKDLHSTPFPSCHTSQCDSCVFQQHSLHSPDFSQALVGGQKGYQTYRELPWDLQK